MGGIESKERSHSPLGRAHLVEHRAVLALFAQRSNGFNLVTASGLTDNLGKASLTE